MPLRASSRLCVLAVNAAYAALPRRRKDAKKREEDFRKRGTLPGRFLVSCPMDGLSGDRKYTRNTGLRCASPVDSIGTPIDLHLHDRGVAGASNPQRCV